MTSCNTDLIGAQGDLAIAQKSVERSPFQQLPTYGLIALWLFYYCYDIMTKKMSPLGSVILKGTESGSARYSVDLKSSIYVRLLIK